MYNLKGVEEPYAYNDLLAEFGCFFFGEVLFAPDVVEEVGSLYEFGDDVDVGFGLDGLFEVEQEGV